MRRQLATELAPYGIRVVTPQTDGVPEDVGNVAVFAASDWAHTLTATRINMTYVD